MKAWYEVALPHRDIREGKFSESVFAADLSDVVAGRGPLEYRDAALFFRQTYPTQGLKDLLQVVLERLAGTGDGDAVIQIQTPFGGGKTHSLIALYHAVQDGAVHLQDWGIAAPADLRARVVTFVGTAADPLHGKTPWGEMAHQLGVYHLLREHDEQRRAPGKELLHTVLGEQPVLLLMDEIVEYAVRAKDFNEQVMAFFQELTETVNVAPRSVLVATLPSSAPYGEEGEQCLQQLQQIFGRVEAVYTPVEGEEIYEVVRRRLFESLGDPAEARRTAEVFWEMYQRLGDDVPSEVRDTAYRRRLERAYPFHPELIDLLFERWSTFASFQRTRGVLRLLAEVVADNYRQKSSSPLILPAQVNLENPTIRRELLKHIGNEYEGVISADIAGAGAKAPQIDREIGSEYARFRVASGLATAIFFGSFSAGERRGMGIQRLRLEVLRHDLPPALVGDALRRLEDALWYLHEEGGTYSFSVQPNLNRVIIDKEEAVHNEHIEQEVRKLLEQHSGRELRVTLWPGTSADVPDTHELKLCILHPEQSRQSGSTESRVQELLDKSGLTFRVHRNTLLVLVADRNEWTALRQRVKRWLALRAVKQDSHVMQQLSNENKGRLESKIREHEDDMPFRLHCTYRHLAKPTADGVQWLDMGLPITGERGSLSKRVVDFLKSEELLLERIAPRVLLRYTLPEGENERAVKEMVAAFWRYPHLPMLPERTVVLHAIAQGVREGVFGVRVGHRVYFRETVDPSTLEDEAVLVREPVVPAAPQTAQEEPQVEQEATTVWQEHVEEEAGLLLVNEPVAAPPAAGRTYYLRARVTPERFSEFLRGVIAPLRSEGARMDMEIVLTARSDTVIQKNTLEQQVRETLRQIGAEVLEERLE